MQHAAMGRRLCGNRIHAFNVQVEAMLVALEEVGRVSGAPGIRGAKTARMRGTVSNMCSLVACGYVCRWLLAASCSSGSLASGSLATSLARTTRRTTGAQIFRMLRGGQGRGGGAGVEKISRTRAQILHPGPTYHLTQALRLPNHYIVILIPHVPPAATHVTISGHSTRHPSKRLMEVMLTLS